MTTRASDVQFGWTGLRDGVVQCIPVAVGVGGYGVVFGILARESGLSVAEAALMSATVLAGAAQLFAVELWSDPVPIVAVVGTTLVVNLRYVLMGASLRPWFRQLDPRQAYGSVFFLVDENWALTMGKLRSGSHQGAFLLGSGLTVWSFWVGATIVGAAAGGVITPARYGLDFALTAIFLAIAVELWEGRATIVPWGAAAAVAVAAEAMLPGNWYVLCGTLAGTLVVGWRD